MKKLPIIVALIVIVAGLGFFIVKHPKPAVQNNSASSADIVVPTAVLNNVNLTASDFSPSKITINHGETVKWINKSGKTASVNSDPYPSNNLYMFLNRGTFEANSSVDVVFEKAGTYTYHNQFIPTERGTVVVK